MNSRHVLHSERDVTGRWSECEVLLQALLNVTANTSCLNSVDKIYSLLGLAPVSVQTGILINHITPVREILDRSPRREEAKLSS